MNNTTNGSKITLLTATKCSTAIESTPIELKLSTSNSIIGTYTTIQFFRGLKSSISYQDPRKDYQIIKAPAIFKDI